jgi:hypothetical protein
MPSITHSLYVRSYLSARRLTLFISRLAPSGFRPSRFKRARTHSRAQDTPTSLPTLTLHTYPRHSRALVRLARPPSQKDNLGFIDNSDGAQPAIPARLPPPHWAQHACQRTTARSSFPRACGRAQSGFCAPCRPRRDGKRVQGDGDDGRSSGRDGYGWGVAVRCE